MAWFPGSGKPGKQGKNIGQGKVREFFYFKPKVTVFFPRMAQCRDFYKILKISRIYILLYSISMTVNYLGALNFYWSQVKE